MDSAPGRANKAEAIGRGSDLKIGRIRSPSCPIAVATRPCLYSEPPWGSNGRRLGVRVVIAAPEATQSPSCEPQTKHGHGVPRKTWTSARICAARACRHSSTAARIAVATAHGSRSTLFGLPARKFESGRQLRGRHRLVLLEPVKEEADGGGRRSRIPASPNGTRTRRNRRRGRSEPRTRFPGFTQLGLSIIQDWTRTLAICDLQRADSGHEAVTRHTDSPADVVRDRCRRCRRRGGPSVCRTRRPGSKGGGGRLRFPA